MMISCLKASELSSKAMDEKLSRGEVIRMWLHILACAFCNEFKRQTEFISKLFKSREAIDNAGPAMKAEARERLKEIVRSRLA